LKIGLVYEHALLSGGYPRDLRWLASGLAALGSEVCVFSKPGGERDGLVADVWLRDLGELNRFDCELYHVFGIFRLPQARLLLQTVARNKPLVVSPWGQLMPFHLLKGRFKKSLYLAALKPWFRRVRWWHVFSALEAASVHNYLGAPVNTFCAGLGVYPVGEDRDEAGQGNLPKGTELLFMGRNDVYQKGIDLLLKGYALARQQGLPWRLTIAGVEHRKSAEHITGFIRENRLENAVTLLGKVSERDKTKLFRQTRYLVFLSRFDGPPRPVREAIAVGTPVIVSPQTNMAEEIDAFGAGLSVDPRPQEVAGVLLQISRDEALYRRHREAVPRLRERLAWPQIAKDYLEGYTNVLEEEHND